MQRCSRTVALGNHKKVTLNQEDGVPTNLLHYLLTTFVTSQQHQMGVRQWMTHQETLTSTLMVRVTNLEPLSQWKLLARRIIVQMMINHDVIGGLRREVVEATDAGIDLEVTIGVIGMTETWIIEITAVIEAAVTATATGIATEAEIGIETGIEREIGIGIETGIETGIGIGIERGTVTVTDQGIDQEIDLETDHEKDIGAEKMTEVIADEIKVTKTGFQIPRNLIEETEARKERKKKEEWTRKKKRTRRRKLKKKKKRKQKEKRRKMKKRKHDIDPRNDHLPAWNVAQGGLKLSFTIYHKDVF
jgi:hypothetical protein